MNLYVFKHFIVCSLLAPSNTTNSAIQTSIIKLNVLVKLETLGEISNEEAVFYIEKKKVGANKKDIEKMHRVLNHKGVRNMELHSGMQKLIAII